MGDEVLEFAREIDAKDLKTILQTSEYRALFKRRNYFLLDGDKFLIVKISRSETPFYGFGKVFFNFFNSLTENGGNYFFVALESPKTGWVLTKQQLNAMIDNKSLSMSEDQYKINHCNLKDKDYFTSPAVFLRKLGIEK